MAPVGHAKYLILKHRRCFQFFYISCFYSLPLVKTYDKICFNRIILLYSRGMKIVGTEKYRRVLFSFLWTNRVSDKGID